MSEQHKYPVIAAVPRPRVPVRRDEDGMSLAACQHCGWEISTTVQAATVEQARWHRQQHQAGRVAVTKGPRTSVLWPQAVAS